MVASRLTETVEEERATAQGAGGDVPVQGGEQITGDMYVVPKRLTSDGFAFTDPTVEYTIDSALRD